MEDTVTSVVKEAIAACSLKLTGVSPTDDNAQELPPKAAERYDISKEDFEIYKAIPSGALDSIAGKLALTREELYEKIGQPHWEKDFMAVSAGDLTLEQRRAFVDVAPRLKEAQNDFFTCMGDAIAASAEHQTPPPATPPGPSAVSGRSGL